MKASRALAPRRAPAPHAATVRDVLLDERAGVVDALAVPGQSVVGERRLDPAQRLHVVGHVALAGMDDGRRAVEDVIARVERLAPPDRRSTGDRGCAPACARRQARHRRRAPRRRRASRARARRRPTGRSSARVRRSAWRGARASGRWSGCECVSRIVVDARSARRGRLEDRGEVGVVIGAGIDADQCVLAADEVRVGAAPGEHRRVGCEHARRRVSRCRSGVPSMRR